MRSATILRRTRALKITGKEGTMRFVSGTLSGTVAMWCRASWGGDISPLSGSLGTLRDRYVRVFVAKAREKVLFGWSETDAELR